MNCILCCVVEQKYIDIFYLFLESIFIYGNLDDNTIILVYTSTSFMNIIIKSHLFNDKKVKFKINDNEIFDFFNLLSILDYDKILYLDNDILVKCCINNLFDVCKNDILYVLEEDPTIFTKRILLFNNCEKIKKLFQIIKLHDINDQPFITYDASNIELYDNKILKSLILNDDDNVDNQCNKVIYQCQCSIETISYQNKIMKMSRFLNNIKDYTILCNINKAKQYINAYLLPIIKRCNELLEGNIFMYHHTTSYTDDFLNKCKNISNLLLNKNIKNVMEIGFNSGFSTLLMLLTNPVVTINCFDLGEHKYTKPCYEKIKETFGDRINIVIGNSVKTLQKVKNVVYDLIHIDGGHETKVADSDIFHSYRLSKQGTILIMDDYDCDNLHKMWDWYIKKYNLKHLDINVYNSHQHDIKYVVR